MCSSIFFFKQKTAYEMRMSDWSSDVCSSDLREFVVGPACGRQQMASMQSFTPKFVKPFSAMVCGRVRIHMTTGCARGRFPRREPHPVGNSREADRKSVV